MNETNATPIDIEAAPDHETETAHADIDASDPEGPTETIEAPAGREEDESDESSDGDGSSESDDEDDDLPGEDPQEGDVLQPGAYLLELTTAIPCRREVLVGGLERMGFKSIRTDQSRSRSTAAFSVREHRLVAHLTRPIAIHQRDDVMRWTFARRLSVDVTKNLRAYRLQLQAFPLEPGVLYEAVFLSRERSQPTRQIVEDNLSEMGFIPVKLTALERDKRLDPKPETSIGIWVGLLEWDTAHSQVTEDDPFYFEELIPVS